MDDRHRLIDRAAELVKRTRARAKHRHAWSTDPKTDLYVARMVAGRDPLTGRTLPTPAWIEA
uniref:Uncharacterized protein n=1 Tax=viral metagenome TaxID=1070528 RepID=A0A6M3L3D2_9ZZZZ